MLVIFTHIYAKDYAIACGLMGEDIAPWIFPFLYNIRFVKILFFLPLVFIFCDAPFISQSQPYVLLRSGRLAYTFGQMLYIVAVSGLYFLFIMLLSNVFVINSLDFTLEWGRVISTLADTDAASIMGIMTFINPKITFYYTPLQAMWYTFFLSTLSGIFLGFLIYAINSISNTKIPGVLCAVFLVVLDSVAHGDTFLLHFSPVSWSTLSMIDVGGLTAYPSINYIFGAFFITLGTLIIVCAVASRKQTIEVAQPV
jgi:hypothetical protein